MSKLKNLKTILLGSAVILLTFAIFTGLPSTIPALRNLRCDRFWCSENVITYDTWIWDMPALPDREAMQDMHRQRVESEGILHGLRMVSFKGPTGKLDCTIDPDDENRIIISGYLQYRVWDSPHNLETAERARYPLEGGLENSLITISILEYLENNQDRTKNYELTTGNDGGFSLNFKPEGYCFRIKVQYEGEILYTSRPIQSFLPCRVIYSTCEAEGILQKKSYWWIWIIVGMTILAIAYLIYKKFPHIRKGIRELPTGIEEIIPPKDAETLGKQSGGDLSLLELSFPDIEPDLPDVWGTDKLRVMVDMKKHSESMEEFHQLQIDWGNDEKNDIRYEDDVRFEVSYTFKEVREYRISVNIIDSLKKKNVSAWRRILIVDYREEMVRLFGEMLHNLNLSDIRIKPDMTPREVERMLSERLVNISKESLSRVIDGFEEANYSIHPVNRESYVRMYRAIGEISG